MGLEIFPAHVPKTPVRKCWACLLVMDERLDAAAAAARSRARFFVKGDQSGVDALFFFFSFSSLASDCRKDARQRQAGFRDR